jgi:hypothetical protein
LPIRNYNPRLVKPKKEKKQAEDGKKPEAAPSEGAKKAKPEENKSK